MKNYEEMMNVNIYSLTHLTHLFLQDSLQHFESNDDIDFIREAHRILKPGGINIFTVRHTGDADYGIGIHKGEDLYETNGFIVHFFSKEKIKQLSNGFEIVNIENFEEGAFPRKLSRVTLKKI